MNDNEKNESGKLMSNIEPEEDEIDLLDLLIVIAKHKRAIIIFTLSAAMIALIVAFLMPKIYTATTTILLPQQGQSSAASMGALSGMAAASLGIKNPSDLYIGMLKSRNVEDALLKRFNLQAVYKTDTQEAARKTIESNSVINSGKDGFISIEFSDKDPKRAADIANAYVPELDRLIATLAVTEASQRRLFYEQQLIIVKDNLAKAESELQKLQAKNGIIQVYPQEQEIAQSNAKLRAEIAAKQVQLSSMKVSVTANNPAYIRLQSEIESLKRLQDGADAGDGLDPSMSKASLDYIEKFRNVKYYQAIMEMLYKQYELAKIDEAKDYPVIQVLDKATPPEKKSKPKRGLIIILSTLVAFFLALFYAFIKESMGKAAADPERSGKIALFRRLAWGRK